ncbi:hypothetical protein ABH926_008491 [Catenulispora sp. GP43]|jgi:hypothetical protein|uniref:three-helix bundle dimerization domain-containing protein n=1 Tax=Catenulispora sp. GP43 TaxID=3156263 RepID=UPI003519B5E0
MPNRSTHMEQDAITALTARLQRIFADAAPQRVADLVEHAYHSFDGSRIRLFIPLLVEHAARDELNKAPDAEES